MHPVPDALRRELARHLTDLGAVVGDYAQPSTREQAVVDLKHVHSLQVTANAAQIAERSGITDRERERCLLAALFHDTGRFPQYAAYKTFQDSSSENHARLGVVELKRRNLPSVADARTRRVVRTAVMLHNRRFLPPRLEPELKRVTQCVRDADKLDILRVMLAHFRGEDGDIPAVRLYVRDDPEAYSSVVYDQVMAGAMGEYAAMRWVNDFKMLLVSWVYGMHYSASLAELRDRGAIREVLDLLPDIPAMSALRDKVLTDLDAMAP